MLGLSRVVPNPGFVNPSLVRPLRKSWRATSWTKAVCDPKICLYKKSQIANLKSVQKHKKAQYKWKFTIPALNVRRLAFGTVQSTAPYPSEAVAPSCPMQVLILIVIGRLLVIFLRWISWKTIYKITVTMTFTKSWCNIYTLVFIFVK